MLETIREFAKARITDTDRAELRTLHLKYYARWSADICLKLQSQDQVAALVVVMELDNVRHALDWGMQHNAQGDNAIKPMAVPISSGACAATSKFAPNQTYFSMLTSPVSQHWCVPHGLLLAGTAAYFQSDWETARRLYEERLTISS